MKNIVFFIFLFGCFMIKAQEKVSLKSYTFSDVEHLHAQNPKPIFIFFHTDWCSICAGMKKTTLEKQEVINLLNDNFYFIHFNGEEKKDITFLGRTFVYEPSGNNTGTHQLSKQLATVNGMISYPTTTILNLKFEIDLQLNGFTNSKKLTAILEKYKSTLN